MSLDMHCSIEEYKRAQMQKTHHKKPTTLSRRANIPDRQSLLCAVCYKPRSDPKLRKIALDAAIKKYGKSSTFRVLRNTLRQAKRVFSEDAKIIAKLREDLAYVVDASHLDTEMSDCESPSAQVDD